MSFHKSLDTGAASFEMLSVCSASASSNSAVALDDGFAKLHLLRFAELILSLCCVRLLLLYAKIITVIHAVNICRPSIDDLSVVDRDPNLRYHSFVFTNPLPSTPRRNRLRTFKRLPRSAHRP